MEQEPTYHLEGVVRSKEELTDFEGPLTLILMLLSKNKIEIRDIRISEILEQYLDYLDKMREMDLEIASEFVQMAAQLLYIKTRMLLSTEEEGPDELAELIASLEQLRAKDVYTAVRQVTPAFAEASAYGMLYHEKPPEPLQGRQEYRYRHSCYELLKALSDALLRGRTAADAAAEAAERRARYLFPKRIVYSVQEKSREILLRLNAVGRVPLLEFYSESRSRSEMVATFLSILELCSIGSALLTREEDTVYVDYSGGDMEELLKRIPE